jgi:uncharacterized protein YjbI with pentapeptide repeats
VSPPKSRPATKGIKAPRLAKALPPADLSTDFPVDGETYPRLEYQHLDLAEQIIARLHFEEVIFTQLNATGSQLPYLRVEDVRFAGGNLANAVWPNASGTRVEFIGCRLTGFTALEAVFLDTIFRDCKVDLAQFYQAKMRRVRFEDCPLNGTDFRETDLTGAVFVRCDLTGADFRGATLAEADLRGCTIDGVHAGPNELRGATIDEVQALALVRGMGITIA